MRDRVGAATQESRQRQQSAGSGESGATEFVPRDMDQVFAAAKELARAQGVRDTTESSAS